VLGLVARRPDLVASWAVDCAGLVHPDHVWHDMARVWQTPGAGEEAVAAMTDLPAAERAAAYRSLGLPDEVAADMAAACDEAMGRCILELYRGAVPPWGPELGHRLAALGPARPPGLVVLAGEDPYVPADLSADVAARLGADICDLAGAGHWWMLTDPEPVADALVDFWSTRPGGTPS
ncbi:MAG: alpha/beta hydrolase, partial [Actinomyces sp.]